MVLSAERSLVRCSEGGAKVRESGRLEVRPRYREALTHCRMLMDFAQLVWRYFLSAGLNLTAILTIEEQDALTQPASPTTSLAMAGDEAPAEGSPTSLAVLDDKEDWTTGALAEIYTEQRGGMSRCHCNLQHSCRSKRQEVPEVVVQAVALAVALVDDATVTSHCAVEVAHPRIDVISGQPARTRVEVILITSKLCNLE